MISIIIVGYNSRNYLNECLSSIFASTYKSLEVIFVDNNSEDNSVPFIKKRFPKVKIITNKKNSGFAGGNNIGIKKAFEHKSEFVFLLNPDTIIEKDCLKKLIETADTKTVLQPLILLNIDGKNTNLINTTGGHLNFLGFSYCSDYKKNKGTAKKRNIAIASGAAVFIPATILKKVGLFDESFFMYHEDVDLFWRARLAGFNIRLIPDSVVWHKYSFSKNKKKMFYSERNRLLFLFKNFSIRYLLLIFPFFVINEIFILIYSLISGWSLLKLNSYLSAIKLMVKYRDRGGIEKALRGKIDLKKFLDYNLSFSEVEIPFFFIYNYLAKLYWSIIKKAV